MSGGDQEVAAKLIVVEKREEQYASILLAERVEKKKKEREAELEVLKNEWISTLTKEYVEDKVSDAIMLGRNQVCLISFADGVVCTSQEFEGLLQGVKTHLAEVCQFKGMRLTYDESSGAYVSYSGFHLNWANASCACVCQ